MGRRRRLASGGVSTTESCARPKGAGDRVAPALRHGQVNGRIGRKVPNDAHSSDLRCGGTATGRASRAPRARPPTTILHEAQDHLHRAGGIEEIVVARLFSAGLALQMTLGLMGEHPGARRIQEAIDEVDLAIRDYRTALFGHAKPSSNASS